MFERAEIFALSDFKIFKKWMQFKKSKIKIGKNMSVIQKERKSAECNAFCLQSVVKNQKYSCICDNTGRRLTVEDYSF